MPDSDLRRVTQEVRRTAQNKDMVSCLQCAQGCVLLFVLQGWRRDEDNGPRKAPEEHAHPAGADRCAAGVWCTFLTFSVSCIIGLCVFCKGATGQLEVATGFARECLHVAELQDYFIHALRPPGFSRVDKQFPNVMEKGEHGILRAFHPEENVVCCACRVKYVQGVPQAAKWLCFPIKNHLTWTT